MKSHQSMNILSIEIKSVLKQILNKLLFHSLFNLFIYLVRVDIEFKFAWNKNKSEAGTFTYDDFIRLENRTIGLNLISFITASIRISVKFQHISTEPLNLYTW